MIANWNLIPLPILGMVTGYLSLRDVWQGSRRVCQHWKQVRANWHIIGLFSDEPAQSKATMLTSARHQVTFLDAHCSVLHGAANLRNYPHLQGLLLRDIVTNDVAEQIAGVQALRRLELRSCESLDFLTRISQLEVLEIEEPVTDEDLSAVAHLFNLQQLKLCVCSDLTENGFCKLASLTQLTSLTLNEHVAISGEGLEIMLSGCGRKLKSLFLASSWTDDMIKAVTERCALLQSLSVCSSSVSRLSAKGMSHIPRLEALEEFCVQGMFVPDFGDQSLRHISRCSQLTKLQLYHVACSNQGIKYLAELQNFKHLTLSDTFFIDTTETPSGFDNLQTLSRLEELSLRSWNGKGLEHLTALPKFCAC
jgi:hypothetical protein